MDIKLLQPVVGGWFFVWEIMKRIFIFLFIALGMFDAMAECVPTTAVTKCSILPNGYWPPITMWDGDYTENSWSAFFIERFDTGTVAGLNRELRHYISGNNASYNKEDDVLTCYINYPFKATYNVAGVGEALIGSIGENNLSAFELCAHYVRMGVAGQFFDSVALAGDKCPDGFYTVSYNFLCGEGMIEDSVEEGRMPLCSENASGGYCLIVNGIPCDVISDCGAVSFTNDGNGKYALKYTACSGGICAKSETQVSACGNGYYGDGITCTKCPQNIMSDIPTYTDNGNGALIINANAREERDCYVTPEMKFSDLSGSYSYESNCSYAPGYVY